MPYEDGVYLHSDRGVCTLKGSSLHTWLTRLEPFLTGEHTLDELTEALPAEQRDMVDKLVLALYEQGFVRDIEADRPHSLTDAECQTYAAEIGFVRYSLDSAEYRFERYRLARVTLLGNGPVLTALLDAGLRSGLRDVHVTGYDPAQLPQLQQVAQRACRDGAQHIEIDDPGPLTDGAIAAVVDASDVVLQIGSRAGWVGLVTVARRCEQAGKVVGQVLVDRDEAWISPVGRSGAESGWRRLGALGSAQSQEGADGEDARQGGWLTGPVPAVIAAQVMLACFGHLTGIDQSGRMVLTRVDLRTLDTRTHSFLAHPLATTPATVHTQQGVGTAIEAYASGPPLSPRELLDRSDAVVDARCGLFGWLDEGELTQLPLWVCRAGISDPFRLLPGRVPTAVVTGHGLEHDDAQLQALLEAFAAYGSLAIDRRRLIGDALGGALGVWGVDLTTGRTRVLPAAVVMPVLGGVVVPYRAPVGAAAGLTWNAAVSAGLRQHCELLLARRLPVADRPCPQLSLDQVAGDERVFRLLRLLVAAAEPVEVYDLRTLIGVPACAVLARAVTVALTCGTTMIDAVARGLERALLGWQARHESQPDYAPPAVPQLGERLRAPSVSDPLPTEAVGITTLVDAVGVGGYRPVVVPLDHDPEAARILPYVAQVALLP